MEHKVQRILLVWSDDDVSTWREGDLAIPLTAEGYVATRRLAPSSVLDAKDGISQCKMVDETATELLNGLHETLKTSKLPWLEAFANVIFETKAFQLIAWLTLIRALQERFGPEQIEIRPPELFANQSWSDDMFIYSLARKSFAVARKTLEREGVLFVSATPVATLRPLRAQPLIRRRVGQAMDFGVKAGLVRLGNEDGWVDKLLLPKGETDVLLVGQQFGDAYHSAPLARKLVEKHGNRFLWIGLRPEAASNMTTEEIALIANLSIESLRFVDSAPLLLEAESRNISPLFDLAGAWHLADWLSQLADLKVNRSEWFDFFDDFHLRGFAIRYQLWSDILERLQPKVVVGLSVLQDMALVRAWARRQGVPFVCFMHGAFYALKYSHDVDADYIGVFGSALGDRLRESDLPQPKKVAVCGAMQFGDKAATSLTRSEHNEGVKDRDSVVFLGFFDALPFCPWSPADTWRMLKDIHTVCQEFGKCLRVRPHPRFPASVWSPFVAELGRQSPGTISLSSEPSLSRDFMESDFVVASGFDGAVLDALFARKLIISYLPRGIDHIDHSRPLVALGGASRSMEELRELFEVLTSKGQPALQLREQQRAFLEHYVSYPEEGPWERALDLIEEVLMSEQKHANDAGERALATA